MGDDKDAVIADKGTRDYDRRHIVARVGVAGHVMQKGVRRAVYRYLTFRLNSGESFGAEFTGQAAPIDNQGNVRLEAMQEGDIIVAPGLVYRRMLTMPGALMVAHLQAMKTWRAPLPLVKPYVDAEDAGVDVGVIDLRRKH